MRKDARQKKLKQRKNFFPTLAVMLLLWAGLAGLIYFVEPDSPLAVIAFFALFFFALLFTFSTVFANSRRGLITSLALFVFLILRYLGVGNILNFLLIAGVAVTIELYFWKKLD